ncbi:MAG: CinA family protein [Bacteroidales bacterium]|nr:CinA family protein [Bacteroidales bacterium]
MNRTNIQTEIKELLCERGKTLSVAESCTGGNISHLLTTVPGSSQYYLGSVTSYAVSVKVKILGVNAQVIEDKGVVSSEVAAAMAEGVKKITGSDYAVATTGLAGPGGDERNPEGTVWIAFTGPHKTVTLKRVLNGSRISNIRQFSTIALKELKNLLIQVNSL